MIGSAWALPGWRRVALAIVAIALVAGPGIVASARLWGPSEATTPVADSIHLVVVPLVAGSGSVPSPDERARAATAAVTDWYGRYGVPVTSTVQPAVDAPEGATLFALSDGSGACSDTAWPRALRHVQEVADELPEDGPVVVVVLGGVIRIPTSPAASAYGLACRLGGGACADPAEVDVPTTDGMRRADAVIGIDWRPVRATPLEAVLAHEIGHALGLAHEGEAAKPCSLPAPAGTAPDSTDLMASARHIEPQSVLADLNLSDEQVRWLRDAVVPDEPDTT
jgi:hypothetical protein